MDEVHGNWEPAWGAPPIVHIIRSVNPVHIFATMCRQEPVSRGCPPPSSGNALPIYPLWAAKDRDSLLAMMQTSRELRLLVSSFIGAIEVSSAASMQPFPRHATVKTLGIWMKPVAVVEAPSWLRASDPNVAGGRLQLV